MHAAEAMWALHGIAILYVRWFQKSGDVAQTEQGLSKNVVNGKWMSKQKSKSAAHAFANEAADSTWLADY